VEAIIEAILGADAEAIEEHRQKSSSKKNAQ
jgi:hypothetical protein